ncbi:MAG: DUF3572 domain-containing protein [Hyphomicrobium sp.]|uniref:DUF3572 domain-containing protein n=1 Tax=Hyphomicrobium sp. TaxID=82 RepID=UPI0039E3A1FC
MSPDDQVAGMFRSKSPRLTEERAEALALQVLAFLVADPKQISRFLSLTGTTPDELRNTGSSRELQIATLEYLLSDEGLLLTFCQDAGLDPASIAPAHQLLSGTQYD